MQKISGSPDTTAVDDATDHHFHRRLGLVLSQVLTVALLLFLPVTLDATSIIGVRTPDSVTLTADSKAGTSAGSISVCKIFRLGRMYFAIAGIDHDSQRGFYPTNIVASNFSESGSFSESVEKVEQAMEVALEKELARLQATNADRFASTVANQGAVIEVVFAEFRDGIPQMGAFGLTYSGSASTGVHMTATQSFCPGDCSDGSNLFHLGYDEGMDRSLAEYRRGGDKLDPVALSRSLVGTAAAADPAEVGPPIVTLHMDKNGVQWTGNRSACPIDVSPRPRH